MTTKIESKIVGAAVKKEEQPEVTSNQVVVVEQEGMHEGISRDEILSGATYKFKHPTKDFAIYVTINNKEIDEKKYPYELFLNCKDPESAQWVFALTRVISAVFRKGGDVTFLVDELKGVFDPQGGYFKRGGIFMPSVVAEIGHILEKHLIDSGVIAEVIQDEAQQKFIKKKREEFEKEHGEKVPESEYPPQATVCNLCSHKSVVIMDGCATCLNCGDSKCN